MTDFQKRPLGILDRIYGFVGGLRSISQVDLSLPIQLVHDVSRQAETGAGRFWLAELTQTHVGAGTITDALDAYNATSSPNPGHWNQYPSGDMGEYDVWLMDVWGALVAGAGANLNGGAVVMTYPGDMVGISDDAAAVNSRAARVIRTYSANVTWNSAFITGSLYPSRWPILIPRGGAVNFSSIETGGIGITARHNALLWVGPRGATPPL